MHGNIIDIKKFSIHDGYGIRSTLFLKGCPLSCLWCHNPEGISQEIRLWYFEKKCISCFKCLQSCPQKALKKGSQTEPPITIDRSQCINDGSCTAICPTDALALDGKRMSSQQVIQILMEDKKFYDNSNGGVTLSGGDPLFQYEFALTILEELKKRKIHTAIETCLYSAKEILSQFIGLVDLFIVDLKLIDSNLHQKYTGQANSLIKENFAFLVSKTSNLIVRIPLIPGITATEKNIKAITKFVLNKSRRIPIELINFNPLAASKYRLMNKSRDFFENMSPFSDQEMEFWNNLVKKEGGLVINETKI